MNDFANIEKDELDLEWEAAIAVPPETMEEIKAKAQAERDALLARHDLTVADVSTETSPVTEKQQAHIRLLGRTKQIDTQIECRKRMQCELEELSDVQADEFIRQLQQMPMPAIVDEVTASVDDIPAADSRSNVERLQEAMESAQQNSAGAATAVATDLVPEFGAVLATQEPTALAYGFPPEVDALITKAKLSPEQSRDLLAKFAHLFDQVGNWTAQVNSIVITSVSDTEAIEKATQLHKIIREDRLNSDKHKKIVKEPYLRPSQLIDGIFKIYIDTIAPLEKLALDKAKYVENLEKERKERIRIERVELLKPLVENIHAFDLHPDKMTDEAFASILESKKELHAIREEQAKKAEADRQRLADEEAAERVKVRRQNERTTFLSSLGFIREADDARYRLEELTVYDTDIVNESDATWAARAETLKPQANAIREAIAVRQREAEQALEQQRLNEQEQNRVKALTARQKEAAALAPDKVKLEELAVAIEAIQFPTVTNDKTIEILAAVKSDLYQTASKLRANIAQLPEAK